MAFAQEPDSDVVDYLDANVAALTKNTNLFRGPEEPARFEGSEIPAECVFVLSTGGPAPESLSGSSVQLWNPQIQVIVRSESISSGQTISDSVVQALSHIDLTNYVEVFALSSRAQYLGAGNGRYHRWSLNLELIREE